MLVSPEEIKDTKELELPYENRFSRSKLFEFIVFLPFNDVWILILVINITVSFSWVTYGICVETPAFLILNPYVECIFELPYYIDIVTAFLHLKFMSWSCKRIHKPRNFIFIIVDTIATIPFRYWFLKDYQEWTSWGYILFSIPLVRAYRIINFAVLVSSLIGMNTWGNALKKFSFIAVIVIHCMSCLWYTVGCMEEVMTNFTENCPQSWTDSVDGKFITLDKKAQWFFLSFYYLMTLVSTVGYGDISCTTDTERVCTILYMISGFIMRGVILGNCTSIQVQSFRHRIMFFRRFYWIGVELVQLKTDRETKNSMINFYTIFWKHREAIRSSPLYKALPRPVRLEVDMDTYYSALKTSHMFHQLLRASQQALASVMETELYVVGEIVQYRGAPKASMLYISSGAINILSATDDETPIATLSAGTIIGEVSLVLSYPSLVQIEAATYTEIQILHQKSMLNLISSYPEIGQQARNVFQAKLRDAKESVQRKNMYSIVEDSKTLQKLKDTVRRKNKAQDLTKPSLWVLDEELEDELHQGDEEENRGYVYIDDNLNLYQMSKGAEAKVEDDVCIRSTCPWVFNPNNDFLFFWNFFICILAFIVCILFPYYIGFKKGIPEHLTSLVWAIFIAYLLDIYFQLSTAIDERGVLQTNLKVIISKKVRSVLFLLDVIATIPIDFILIHIEDNVSDHIVNYLRLNRVIKAVKIIKFFQTLEGNIRMNIGALRMLKSLIFLIVVGFWVGTVYYMMACTYEVCYHNCWMACVIVEDCDAIADRLEVSRHEHEALLSLYVALQTLTGTGLGDIVPRNYTEIIVVIIFLFLGFFLIVYLISDYSAMLILQSTTRMQFKELVLMMQKFLENNNMPIPFQRRVYDYLSLQWTYREGFFMLEDKSLYFDAPEQISNNVEIARRGSILSKMPLFKNSKEECIKQLCILANSHILPPNEMVVYAGDMCHEFYILEEGFCEEIAGATGDVLRVLSPPSNFCSVEMLFSICVVNSVRTVTHCKLSRITYQQLYTVLLHYSDLERDINKTVRNVRVANILSTLTDAKAELTFREEERQDKSSWYTYPRASKKYIDTDYISPFMDMGTFRFIRFFLLKRTLLPYGKFLKWYEGFRSSFAFLSAIIFPAVTHLRVTNPWLSYVCIVLDSLAFIDMYMRLHIAYYNENGILVSHPWWTAKHYLKNDFLFDLIGCLPINYLILNVIFSLETSKDWHEKENVINYAFHMNRVLQARRIPTLIAHFETSLLARTQILKFLKYIPFSIILMNSLASLLIGFSITYHENAPPTLNPNSWLSTIAHEKSEPHLNNPFRIHLRAVFYMGGTGTSTGTGEKPPQSATEMIFIVIAIVTGYLFTTFVTVKISSSKVNDNINLTSYQERMSHLINFMKSEGHVPKELKNQIINHFEHIWQRTRGIQASKIISKFHNALKRDAVLHLFEGTLMNVPPFAGFGRSFYRRVGMILLEDYYIKGAYILKQNDVVDKIFIVHKGEIQAVAGDGTQVAVLERGSMFGNLFNCSGSRSLLTFIASKHVDVLITSTKEFYNLIQDFPSVNAKIERSFENYTGYLKHQTYEMPEERQSLLKKSTVTTKTTKRTALVDFLTNTTVCRNAGIFLLVCAVISSLLITYEAAFQVHNYFFVSITYFLEIIYILKICVAFYLPYQDETGEIITNTRMIGKRYIRNFNGFWIDFLSAVPADALALIFGQTEQKWEWASYLRCIHMVRMVYIFRYFNLKYERLNVNMLVQKLFSTTIYFSLFLHCAACIWYTIGKNDRTARTWVYTNNSEVKGGGFKFRYKDPYSTSIYFVSSLLTTVGQGDMVPKTVEESLFCILMVCVNQPITALFIGEMSATIATSTYTLVNKDYDTNILKTYMKNDQVSGPLIKKVVNYVKMLWVLGRGMQVPDFLTTAPKYLIEEFKVASYGMHIHEAVIFKDCHNDFLRQLITRLKRYTFFPGNCIAYEGEVNNTMYFIHQGTVEAVTQNGSIEYLYEVLNERDIFGVTQGLRKGTTHKYTYKAVTVVIVLSLKYTNWEYLSAYFPSSMSKIHEELDKLNFN